MTSSTPTNPPDPDELELSLFGPGFGECLVAHLGCGDWIIVDSCVAPDGKTPAGLAYLSRLGLDPATAVKCVVATHWHDDHVRGLAQTMQECTTAKFVCSQALLTKEFIALTDLWKRQRLVVSPVTELAGVLDAIAKSNSALKGSGTDSPIRFAVANRCLWRRPHDPNHGQATSAEIHSLSPSDAAIRKSLEAIAALFPRGDTLIQPQPSRPNHFSVVLWLRAADTHCLLGADMEEQSNPSGGWRLIVASAERPQGSASMVKVPHHGSVTGECAAVWDQMLLRDPVALLTPFHHGRVRLPTQDDANRICGRTPDAFITAGFHDRSSRGKTGSVNRTIQETVRYIRRLNDSFGQLRARKSLKHKSRDWTVEIFGDARRLSGLYATQSP